MVIGILLISLVIYLTLSSVEPPVSQSVERYEVYKTIWELIEYASGLVVFISLIVLVGS